MILKKIRLMDAKNPVRNAQAAFADRVYSASAASVLFRILGRDHFFRTVGFLSIIALVDFIVIDIVEIIRIRQVARIIRINLNVEVFNFALPDTDDLDDIDDQALRPPAYARLCRPWKAA